MNTSQKVMLGLVIAVFITIGSWGLYAWLNGAEGEVSDTNTSADVNESQPIDIDLVVVNWETFHGLEIPIPEGFSVDVKIDSEMTISSDRDEPKTFGTFYFVLPGKESPLHIEESEYTKIIANETYTINGIIWDYQLNTTDLGIDDVSWTTEVMDGTLVYFYHSSIDSETYRAILEEVQKE
ncbi:MAG: hypothetical protein V1838_05510 [Patescibacteria group bacterium]